MTTTRRSIPGLVTFARHGREHYQMLGRLGSRKALSIYADSDEARTVRLQDMRDKKRMTDRQWQALMRRREISFGLPVGSLTKRAGLLPADKGE